MISFAQWLGVPDTPENARWLELILTAHKKAALQNGNASSVAVQVAAQMQVPITNAYAAGLMTLGQLHAPVAEARGTIFHASLEQLKHALESKVRLAGWGNSFFKDQIDPAFAEVAVHTKGTLPEVHEHLDRISELLEKKVGKPIYPNAAAYTAVCAQAIGLPAGTEPVLFVAGRLPAWTLIYSQRGTKSDLDA